LFHTRPLPEARHGVPARQWAYRELLQAIQAGALAPGTRLPSARQLAQLWRVARGAIDAALAQLQDEGLVERRVGHGSTVAQRLRRPALTEPARADHATQRALRRLTALVGPEQPYWHAAGEIPRLSPGASDTQTFPLALWRRELGRVLESADRAHLSYGLPGGVHALRAATARHLALTRSIRCLPEQVLIVGSPRQAVELAARVLLEPGDCVCVDDPGPVAMASGLGLADLQMVGVPSDEQGFDIGHVQRHAPKAAALVLQPLHQWPTGGRMSGARRREVLDWADRTGAWLVELVSLGEIVHDGAAPPALQCSDRSQRVFHVGSFSALTFPTLRLAYLVVPEPLVPVFTAVRGLMGEHNSVAMQMTLAAFMEAGHLDTYVRQLRQLYRGRRDALVEAVAREITDGVHLGPVDGGTHACLRLGSRWRDQAVAEQLAHRGVGAQALSLHARSRRDLNGLVLGYGGDDEDAIRSGIREVGHVLRGA
jgi:GntR family transcriptional regulator/MocR family aminotransferase